MSSPDSSSLRRPPGERAAIPPDVHRLLQEHLGGLRAFLRARAGPAIRARLRDSDLVQAVCVEVLEHAPRAQFANSAAFRGWLYTTALRKLMDHHRRITAEKRDIARERPLEHKQDDEDAPIAALASIVTPSMLVIAREGVAQIEAALDALPEAQREVLLLARMVGLSHAQIAAQTGRTEQACRQLLRRAILRLGQELQQRGFDLGNP